MFYKYSNLALNVPHGIYYPMSIKEHGYEIVTIKRYNVLNDIGYLTHWGHFLNNREELSLEEKAQYL
jgi:hypothetical protein